MFWKKKKNDIVLDSQPTDPSNLLLTDLKMYWHKMPSGTRFRYYDSSNRKDIISGEGGSVLAKVTHHPLRAQTFDVSAFHYCFETKHKSITYCLCLFRDKLMLIKEKDIRIIEPTKKPKKKTKKEK